MNIMSSVNKDQRQVQTVITNEFNKSNGLKNLCKYFNKIGYPRYYPRYMISGMRRWIGEGFNAKLKWKELISTNCDNK